MNTLMVFWWFGFWLMGGHISWKLVAILRFGHKISEHSNKKTQSAILFNWLKFWIWACSLGATKLLQRTFITPAVTKFSVFLIDFCLSLRPIYCNYLEGAGLHQWSHKEGIGGSYQTFGHWAVKYMSNQNGALPIGNVQSSQTFKSKLIKLWARKDEGSKRGKCQFCRIPPNSQRALKLHAWDMTSS